MSNRLVVTDSCKVVIVRKEYLDGSEKFEVRVGTSFNRTSELWEGYVVMNIYDDIEEARDYKKRLLGKELVKEEVIE